MVWGPKPISKTMVMVLVLNLESQRLIIPMVRWLSLMMVLMISMVAATMLQVRIPELHLKSGRQ